MKRIKTLAIAALTAAATMLPLSASATTPSAVQVEPQRPGACRHAWMHIWASNVPVYSEPTTTSRELTRLGPDHWPCRVMQVGGRYDMCGAVNTGWVLLPAYIYPRQGWIPSQCTEDPVVEIPPDTFAGSWVFVEDPVQYQRPGACRHAWMRTRGRNLAVRSEPRATARELARIETPRIYPCRAMQVGGLYEACDVENTGWILIPLHPYPAQGWIPNQCTEDPYPVV